MQCGHNFLVVGGSIGGWSIVSSGRFSFDFGHREAGADVEVEQGVGAEELVVPVDADVSILGASSCELGGFTETTFCIDELGMGAFEEGDVGVRGADASR